jgi:hypothetical protein
VEDLFAFLSAFAGGSPAGDLDGDGRVTIQDFLAFLARFGSGCV